MISNQMIGALNEQIELEAYASFIYLSMSSWCDKEGLKGCAQFLRRQSDEERAHMLRLFDYLAEVDAHAITPMIRKPPFEFESIQKIFQSVYEHEQKVTHAINSILKLSQKENDYTSYNFLQWYIEEQREEEDLIRTILDKIRLIGQGPQSLYYIDKELEVFNQNQLKKEDEPAE